MACFASYLPVATAVCVACIGLQIQSCTANSPDGESLFASSPGGYDSTGGSVPIDDAGTGGGGGLGSGGTAGSNTAGSGGNGGSNIAGSGPGGGFAGGGGNANDPCASLLLSCDFENGVQGFDHLPTSNLAEDDPWGWGTPNDRGCHSGTHCFKTDLTGTYSGCQTAELFSPAIDLRVCAGSSMPLTLSFWHYYDFEPFTHGIWPDGGLVQISSNDGATWDDVSPAPPYQGTIRGEYQSQWDPNLKCNPIPAANGHPGWSGMIPTRDWTAVTINIPAEYRVQKFRFRFLFGSDLEVVHEGWWIDDIQVSSR